MPHILIKYKTREFLNHNESQIETKQKVLNEYRNTICSIVKDFFGDFDEPHQSHVSSQDSNNYIADSVFLNDKIYVHATEKAKKESYSKDNTQRVNYTLTIQVKALQGDTFKDDIAQKIVTASILHKKIDPEASIKYTRGLFMYSIVKENELNP